MALGARRLPNAGGKTCMADLPPEILQHICSLLHDPDDVANCHLVDTGFCAAARAALHNALPQHPGFLKLALRHRYPLRRLDTAELPYCDLGSYLAKAPSTLTSLHIARRTVEEHPRWSKYHTIQGTLPLAGVLRGIRSLRSLSCTVSEDNLDGLQPQQAGLLRLSLSILERHQDLDTAAPCCDFRGLAHLTNLTRLTLRTSDVIGGQPLSVIAGLTTLRCLRLPSPSDPSPLSSLSRLMALVMGVNGNEERYDGNFEEVGSSEGDEHIAALVQAVPQLRTLRLFNYATDLATDAGLRQLSKLSKLQHLSLSGSFGGCTLNGLGAALTAMNDLAALSLLDCAFMTNEAMSVVALCSSLTALFVEEQCDYPRPDDTSGTWDMLKALGPRLQHLSVTYSADTSAIMGQGPIPGNSLSPYMLRYCPLLAHVTLDDLRAGQTAQKKVRASLKQYPQLCLSCPAHAEVSLLRHAVGLRRLNLKVGYLDYKGYKIEEYSLVPIIRGLRCLVHLQCLRIDMMVTWSGPLLGMLEAVASCSGLTCLQLAEGYVDPRARPDKGLRGVGASHLRALAALSQLTALNLYSMPWAEDAVKLGLGWLVARMLHLRILGASQDVLSEAVSGAPLSDRGDAVARYELRDLPGRRLRRWPRGTRRTDERPPLYMWNMLETYRWPWED